MVKIWWKTSPSHHFTEVATEAFFCALYHYFHYSLHLYYIQHELFCHSTLVLVRTSLHFLVLQVSRSLFPETLTLTQLAANTDVRVCGTAPQSIFSRTGRGTGRSAVHLSIRTLLPSQFKVCTHPSPSKPTKHHKYSLYISQQCSFLLIKNALDWFRLHCVGLNRETDR